MSKRDKAALEKGAAEIRKAQFELSDTRLIQLEKVIECGLETFIDVGAALLEIRDGKLYKPTYSTFELYCSERWKMSRPRAYQLIESSKVVENLSTTVDIQPTSERQVRPLTGLTKKAQRKAWKKAVQSANGEQPTARQVKAASDRIKRRARLEPPPYVPTPDEERALSAIEKQAKKLAELITPEITHVAMKLDHGENQRWLDILAPITKFQSSLYRVWHRVEVA